MSKMRLMALSLMAVFALSGVVAASASAHEFLVEGKPVEEKNPIVLNGKSKVTKFKVKARGVRFTIECKKDKIKLTLEAGGKTKIAITGEECKVVGVPGCVVPIFIVKGKDKLVIFLGKLGDEIESEFIKEKENKSVAELTIESCTVEKENVSGKYIATGTQSCELPSIETEQVEHELVCTPEGGKLEVEKSPAEFEGTESELKTEKGQKWDAK